jgi:hypothetical protein
VAEVSGSVSVGITAPSVDITVPIFAERRYPETIIIIIIIIVEGGK